MLNPSLTIYEASFWEKLRKNFQKFSVHLGQTVPAAGASAPVRFGGCAAVTAFRAPIYLGSREKGKSQKEFLIFLGQVVEF